DPPNFVVVNDLKTEKNEEGKEEKVGKAQILSAEVGLRDREHVEILSLRTVEKKQPVAIQDVWFVTKGAQGLHDDDPVKLEEEEEEKGKEEKGKEEKGKEEKDKEGKDKEEKGKEEKEKH